MSRQCDCGARIGWVAGTDVFLEPEASYQVARATDCARLLFYRQEVQNSGLETSTNVMNTTAKIQHKGQVTIPTSVRRQAGLSKGDLVNFTFTRSQNSHYPKTGD